MVERDIRELYAEGAPTRMDWQFRAHWNKPLHAILSGKHYRKLAWIKTAWLILDKAQEMNDLDGTTQMQNTIQEWLQTAENTNGTQR